MFKVNNKDTSTTPMAVKVKSKVKRNKKISWPTGEINGNDHTNTRKRNMFQLKRH